jgi:fibronectin type 3 domain-containing protein
MRFLSPRHALAALLTLALFFCVSMAWAGTVNLTWTNPTTRTDGSPVTVAQNKVYRGATCATQTVIATIPVATAYVDTTAPAGTPCYAVTALDAAGLESAKSTPATATVPVAPPSAPTGLTTTVQVSDTGAYKLRQSVDGFTFVRIGTVPAGTACAAQTVGEYAVVPRSAVTLASRFDTLPLITFARCA